MMGCTEYHRQDNGIARMMPQQRERKQPEAWLSVPNYQNERERRSSSIPDELGCKGSELPDFKFRLQSKRDIGSGSIGHKSMK